MYLAVTSFPEKLEKEDKKSHLTTTQSKMHYKAKECNLANRADFFVQLEPAISLRADFCSTFLCCSVARPTLHSTIKQLSFSFLRLKASVFQA